MHTHIGLVCRALERLITTGSLHPQPPHAPKWKATKYYHLLEQVVEALAEGKVTDGVQTLPYSSIEEAATERPVIDEICDAIGIESYSSLWRLVQQAFPDIKKKNLHMVGHREPVQAQHAAERLCGRRAMDFGFVTNDETLKHHPLMERFVRPGFEAFYKASQLMLNVFLDAGKMEAEKWSLQRTGIVVPGTYMERAEHTLLKRGVCISRFSKYQSVSISPCTHLHRSW